MLLALLVGASPAPGRGGVRDYGDAADGARAGYLTRPAVRGAFPAKAASRGPAHLGAGALRLGALWDGEANSHQVDADRFDDGASLSGRACRTTTLTVAVNAGRLGAAGRGATVYVNAWFDWNRDGDWADPTDGCAPEWGVRNLPVAVSSLSGGVAMLPITIKAGRQLSELWYRVTLTLGTPVIDPAGRGRTTPYAHGETEDFLHRAPRGRWLGGGGDPPPERRRDKFSVSCAPPVQIISHGGTATVRFVIVDKGKGHIWGKQLGDTSEDFRRRLIRDGNQGGVPKGFSRGDGFSFTNKHVDGPPRVESFALQFGFQRRNVIRKVTCRVLVIHQGGPPRRGQPPKIPLVPCPPVGCGGVLPEPLPLGASNVRFEPLTIGGTRLRVFDPLPTGGVQIPLFPPNPVPVDPPAPPPFECELRPLTLQGGPATLVCRKDIPGGTDSPFDVALDLNSFAGPLRGNVLDSAGTPVRSFEAQRGGALGTTTPPTPSVNGSGALTPGPTPNAINYGVSFNFQNTPLNQFIIQLPAGMQAQSAPDPPGFDCSVVNFDGPNRGVACNGPITSGQAINGGFELVGQRPETFPGNFALLASPGDGSLFGPFALPRMPASTTAQGTMSAPGGNNLNFSLTVSSFAALDNFFLQLPMGVQVQSGTAAGFTCNPTNQGGTNRTLQCAGSITSGQAINGSLTLTGPPPAMPGANTDLFVQGPNTGGQLGPFDLTDTP